MIPGWLTTAGLASWLALGCAGIVWVLAWFFAASSGISVPLLLALVLGMLMYPIVERMTSRGIPKAAAGTLVLLLLAGVIIGVI
jgi:predicted PurR-regulated permease PerM